MSNGSNEKDAKRLRSSEPDLKIILGSGDDTSTQWHHSASLALKSKYIDTMLSTPMREQESRTITFPDISPALWDKMINFLDDPLAVLDMKPEDARDVAPFYDKYEFTQGCKLCERVLLDYFKTLDKVEQNRNQLEESRRLDIDMVIDLTVIAHEANMSSAFYQGMHYLFRKLALDGFGTSSLARSSIIYRRNMFTEDHLKKIFPMLKHCSPSNTNYPGYLLCRLMLMNELKRSNWNKEDDGTEGDGTEGDGTELLEIQGIEQQFVRYCQAENNLDLLRKCISHVELSGTHINADGSFIGPYGPNYDCEFRADRSDIWDGERVQFKIKYTTRGDEQGWAILRFVAPPDDDDTDDEEDEEIEYKICWWAQYSANYSLPPFEGWIPQDKSTYGNPKIKYILNKRIG